MGASGIDADSDGYCSDVDCNDADASTHPGATEVCWNGKDDNCDGHVDEGCVATVTGFAPVAGGPGTTVVITGANLPPNPAVALALGGGVTLTVASSTATRIVARIDPTSLHGAAPFTISFGGAQVGSSAGRFTLTAPSSGFVVATPFALAVTPRWLAVGDLNGDGFPDAVVTTDNGGNPGPITVIRGRADGGFGGTFDVYQPSTSYMYPINPFATVGDVNGDGWLDILSVEGNGSVGSSALVVALNDGGGGFPVELQARYTNLGKEPVAAAVGDLNGDGVPDVAVASINPASTTALLGSGDGGLQSLGPFSYPNSGIDWCDLADVNGDNVLDLVASDYGLSNNDVAATAGAGDGTFLGRQAIATCGRPKMVTTADVDGDGIPDLLTIEDNPGGAGKAGVYFSDGAGGFSASACYTAGPGAELALVAIDLNGDGIPDMATISAYNDSTVRVFSGLPDAGFSDGGVYAVAADPAGIAFADMNGDGLMDLVVTNSTSQKITVLLGQ